MLVPLWNAQDSELRWIYTALSTSVSVSNMHICSSVVLWQNRKALIRFYCAAFRLYSFYNQKLQRITASCLFPTVKSNNVLKKLYRLKLIRKIIFLSFYILFLIHLRHIVFLYSLYLIQTFDRILQRSLIQIQENSFYKYTQIYAIISITMIKFCHVY